MKKALSKVAAKVSRKNQPQEPAGRITTETLAEHREQVLAGGRKFKYPVQYQRHKLVLNTIIIAIAAIVLLLGVGWYLLYQAQDTSNFMYRAAKVVPVPVAFVDGQNVRYSDYLMKYRSAAHYLIEKEQIDARSDSGKHQLNYVKQQAMNDTIADAYAVKLARELDVKVTDVDLETFLKQQRQSNDGEVSEATYNSVIRDYYGWSPDEYREAMRSKLLRQKVAYAADSEADALSRQIGSRIAGGEKSLEAIATAINSRNKDTVRYTGGTWVPRNNQDGGLAFAASQLKPGEVSGAIKTTSGDGYYYVKLVESTDSQVRYEYLHIPLKTFAAKLAQVEKDGKLEKFIKIKDLTTQE